METKNIEGLVCFTLELSVETSKLSKEMGVLILESDSTPNYYVKNNFPPAPEHLKEKHFFLPIKNTINCFQDLVYRKANILKEKYNSNFEIFPGQLVYQNIEKQGVRITINSVDELQEIISEFKEIGLDFFPHKNVNSYTSLITYKKYVNFQYIEDGVYQDANNPNRFFFETSKQIEFKDFQDGITKIKHSCNYHTFDSFLAFLIHNNTMNDYIGIYSLHCDKSRFKDLKVQIKNIF